VIFGNSQDFATYALKERRVYQHAILEQVAKGFGLRAAHPFPFPMDPRPPGNQAVKTEIWNERVVGMCTRTEGPELTGIGM